MLLSKKSDVRSGPPIPAAHGEAVIGGGGGKVASFVCGGNHQGPLNSTFIDCELRTMADSDCASLKTTFNG